MVGSTVTCGLLSFFAQKTIRGESIISFTTTTFTKGQNNMSDSSVKASDEKFCSECGSVIRAKAEICPKCGVRQMNKPMSINLGPVAENGKSRIAAALFAVFLGGFGAHKFYLGQVGLGIVYLIFFWTCIPAIIGFIEFILLLTMSDEAFNQKYGRV